MQGVHRSDFFILSAEYGIWVEYIYGIIRNLIAISITGVQTIANLDQMPTMGDQYAVHCLDLWPYDPPSFGVLYI